MFSQIFYSGFRRKDCATIDAAEASSTCDARKSNGITGLSLSTEGVFLSVIEGPEAQTKAILETVQTDPRFTEVQLIMENTIDNREFEDYRVGLSHVDLSEDVPSTFKLNASSYKENLPQAPSSELAILTNTFARVNALK